MRMRPFLMPAIAALLVVSAAPARAQDATPDAAVTADSCTPQPRCRSLYTTMQPGRHFQVVMLHRHMMMHRHPSVRHVRHGGKHP